MADVKAAGARLARRGLGLAAGLMIAGALAVYADDPVESSVPRAMPYDQRVQALSLRDCIRMAVLSNADVEVERYNPEISDAERQSAYGEFDVVAFFETKNRKAKQDSEQTQSGFNFFLDFLNLGSAVIIHEDNYRLGFRKKWDLGTQTEVSYLIRRSKTMSGFASKPQFTGQFDWKFTQPLLRGFGHDANLGQIRQREAAVAASEHALTDSLSRTVADVEQAYWDLVFARRDRDARREILRLADEILAFNRKKVTDGLAEPIIVLQAEANAAQYRDGLIQAESAIRASEDNLRKLVEHTDNPNYWNYSIEPTDVPTVYSDVPDLSSVMGHVYQQRWDYQKAVKDLEGRQAALAQAEDGVLPRLDIVWHYSRTNFDRDLGVAVHDSIYEKFDDWDIGAVFEYPLGNNAALGSERRAKLQVMQASAGLKGLERRIMKEVVDGIREVRSGLDRVQATHQSADLTRRKLEAEREKYTIGLASGQFVLEYQKDLASALQEETAALRDYNKAWARLRRAMGINLQGLDDVVRAARQPPKDAHEE